VSAREKKRRRAALLAEVRAAQEAVDALPIGRPFSREHANLRDADRRLRLAREKLARHDKRYGRPRRRLKKTRPKERVNDLVPGAPSGLISGGVGLRRIGGLRIVGDSGASHRRHNVFRKK
jgi:hypothetical protein